MKFWRTRLAPDRHLVRDEASRLLASQEARWGLACAHVDWAIEGPAITTLRERVYRGKLPHMIAEGRPVDDDDARAHHFVVRREGTLVGAMRLLSAPFEAEALFPALATYLRDDTQYVEIGRMVVDPGTGEVGASRLLSLYGLVWGLTHTPFDGLIAYARARTVNHFRLLGLEVVAEVDAPEGRANQPYVLMVAHRENTLKHLGSLGQLPAS